MVRTKENDAELIGFTDVAGFAGVEDGEAIIKPLEVSVNREVAGLPTKFSQRIHGERIEIWKRKLPAKSSGQMSAVEKHFKEVQKPFEHTQGNMSIPSREYEKPEKHQSDSQDDKLSPLGVLKNAFDNLDRRVGQIDNWLKVALILGTVGVISLVLTIVR